MRDRLSVLVGSPVLYRPSSSELAAVVEKPRAVLAWGNKKSSAVSKAYALKHKLPLLFVEDGFLRSVELGFRSQPLSLVFDEGGIYYDASVGSDLEKAIVRSLDEVEAGRAQALRQMWCAGRLSKYNHAREYGEVLPENYVLVADQTAGDLSISSGLADASSFERMLQCALEENPDSQVLLKVHPDVVSGRKKGHFDPAELAAHSRITLIAEEVHPARLIEGAQKIYTVTSQLGFEGLIWGKPVHCFGMPFYAGWGLTVDALQAPERRRTLLAKAAAEEVSIEMLVHASLVDYPRYFHPETLRMCDAEEVFQWMALQRVQRERFPSPLYALGFSRWKKPILRDFLAGSRVEFVRRVRDVPSGAKAVVWGARPEVAECRERGVSVLRVEDGFLRSVGLGAELIRPLSWAVDASGMYYDSRQPSDLENLLASTEFSQEICERAADLRRRIVSCDVTKYNLRAQREWVRPDGVGRVLLVVGQVERDASLAYGAPELCTAQALLGVVREANPDDFILYKPHPDVVAGLRPAGEGEKQIGAMCDQVVTDCSISQLIAEVDEVHVLTSLAGFEALLRGKRVVTYGQPFYAGWGLTEDRCPVKRRGRKLTLDELVAGALILYPTYVSRVSRCFATPERALDELLEWREAPAEQSSALWRCVWRRVLGLVMRCRT